MGNGKIEGYLLSDLPENIKERCRIHASGESDEDAVLPVDHAFRPDEPGYFADKVCGSGHRLSGGAAGDAVCHEQLEQSGDEHPVQEPPDRPDDLNLAPVENPNEDMFFCGSLSPHSGHSGTSSPKTITSNSLPHLRQVYS